MRLASCLSALLLLALLSPCTAVASVELRSAASLDIRIARPLLVSLKEELRADMRPGEQHRWLQSVSLQVRPIKWLSIEPQYRLSRYVATGSDESELSHRLSLALRGRVALGPVRLSLRERYQVRFRNSQDSPRQQLVSKVTAKIRHRRLPLEPAFWCEFFLRLPEDDDPVLAEKIRVGLGISMPAGLCDVGIELQLEKSIKNANEAATPILAMNFDFALDARPKKD
jgi:hypothetical protein